MAAVWGLIRNLHLIQVLPREGEYRLGVIVQMCDIALCWRLGHVKHQLSLRRLIVFGIQSSCGDWGQDELIYF